MPVFTDQLGRQVEIVSPPERIISLVPSQTELLFSLGLDTEVAGITKFCVHPKKWFETKTKIGGTKNISLEKIILLKPDLVIANKEENLQAQISELEKISPVWISDVNDLSSALQMIQAIGEITGKSTEAAALVTTIQSRFKKITPLASKPKTAYLIWNKPLMAAGGDTFIHAMMQQTGLENVFASQLRYPETTIEDLHRRGTELILLSSEPYPFSEKHIALLQEQMPGTKVVLADGEMFSWYGSRMQHAADYLQYLPSLLH